MPEKMAATLSPESSEFPQRDNLKKVNSSSSSLFRCRVTSKEM